MKKTVTLNATDGGVYVEEILKALMDQHAEEPDVYEDDLQDDASFGFNPSTNFVKLIDLFEEDKHADQYKLTIAKQSFPGSKTIVFERKAFKAYWDTVSPKEVLDWQFCRTSFDKLSEIKPYEEDEDVSVMLHVFLESV